MFDIESIGLYFDHCFWLLAYKISLCLIDDIFEDYLRDLNNYLAFSPSISDIYLIIVFLGTYTPEFWFSIIFIETFLFIIYRFCCLPFDVVIPVNFVNVS